MYPQFSYSPTLLHHDIKASMPINWVEDVPRNIDPEWNDKLDERLLWRGRNTGIWHDVNTQWRISHRVRLVRSANELDGNITLLQPAASPDERVGEGVPVRKARVNPAMLDVGFAPEPSSCAPRTCEELREMFDWRSLQSLKTAGRYKYVLDVICFPSELSVVTLTQFGRSMEMAGPAVSSV